ncbi:MAG: hypothetical protein GX295_01965 [Syntrophomonadaceae bacterium]|mgnify:CR=1 FL=1|nr:hypothetical protein [Syntrophomonadaceae bacterium]
MNHYHDSLMEEDLMGGPLEYEMEEWSTEEWGEEEMGGPILPEYPPGYRRHFHSYQNRTSVDRAHDHRMGGFTGFAVNFLGTHVHRYMGVTSRDMDHRHRYAGWTERAMGPLGTHVHNYSGTTSTNRGHDHRYRGRTSRPRRSNIAY